MKEISSMARGLLEKIVRETEKVAKYGVQVTPTRAHNGAQEALRLLKRGIKRHNLVTFDSACYEAAANYGAWLYLRDTPPKEVKNAVMDTAARWGVGQMEFALGEEFGAFAPPNALFAPTEFHIRPSTAEEVGYRPYKGELQEAYDAVVRLA